MYIAASSSCTLCLSFSRLPQNYAQWKKDDFWRRPGKGDQSTTTRPFPWHHLYCTSALPTWKYRHWTTISSSVSSRSIFTPWHLQSLEDCDIRSASLNQSEDCGNSDPISSTTLILICLRKTAWRNRRLLAMWRLKRDCMLISVFLPEKHRTTTYSKCMVLVV